MSHTVHIRNADWAIVWDAERERHLHRTAADVVFTDGLITHVGASWHGKPMDCRGPRPPDHAGSGQHSLSFTLRLHRQRHHGGAWRLQRSG